MKKPIFWINGSTVFKLGAFYVETHRSSLSKNYEVIEIGDTQEGVSCEKMEEILSSKFKEKCLELPKTDLIEILIYSHGILRDNKLIIMLNQENKVTTDILFPLLSKCFDNRPIKLMLSACYGKTAQNDFHLLPKWSQLITFPSEKSPTHVSESFISSGVGKLLNESNGFSFEQVIKIWSMDTFIYIQKPSIGYYDRDGKQSEKSLETIITSNMLKDTYIQEVVNTSLILYNENYKNPEGEDKIIVEKFHQLIKEIRQDNSILQKLHNPWLNDYFPNLFKQYEEFYEKSEKEAKPNLLLCDDSVMDAYFAEFNSPKKVPNCITKFIREILEPNIDLVNQILTMFLVAPVLLPKDTEIEISKSMISSIRSANIYNVPDTRVDNTLPTYLFGIAKNESRIDKVSFVNAVVAEIIYKHGLENLIDIGHPPLEDLFAAPSDQDNTFVLGDYQDSIQFN